MWSLGHRSQTVPGRRPQNAEQASKSVDSLAFDLWGWDAYSVEGGGAFRADLEFALPEPLLQIPYHGIPTQSWGTLWPVTCGLGKMGARGGPSKISRTKRIKPMPFWPSPASAVRHAYHGGAWMTHIDGVRIAAHHPTARSRCGVMGGIIPPVPSLALEHTHSAPMGWAGTTRRQKLTRNTAASPSDKARELF